MEKFFSGMTDDEKRDNKNLRCKMAKEIFKREALSKKVTMLELEKQEHDKQMSDAQETIRTLQKELAGQKKQIDVHRTRKEYMEYVADEANKDNKIL